MHTASIVCFMTLTPTPRSLTTRSLVKLLWFTIMFTDTQHHVRCVLYPITTLRSRKITHDVARAHVAVSTNCPRCLSTICEIPTFEYSDRGVDIFSQCR
eukprot:m.197043 g.197043  ORF g.197043 m.197043 type:complete len:99 (-) comp32644_c0_seq2:1146-1442(-)